MRVLSFSISFFIFAFVYGCTQDGGSSGIVKIPRGAAAVPQGITGLVVWINSVCPPTPIASAGDEFVNQNLRDVTASLSAFSNTTNTKGRSLLGSLLIKRYGLTDSAVTVVGGPNKVFLFDETSIEAAMTSAGVRKNKGTPSAQSLANGAQLFVGKTTVSVIPKPLANGGAVHLLSIEMVEPFAQCRGEYCTVTFDLIAQLNNKNKGVLWRYAEVFQFNTEDKAKFEKLYTEYLERLTNAMAAQGILRKPCYLSICK